MDPYYGGERLYRLWVGELVYYDPGVLALLLLCIVPHVLWSCGSQLLMATNCHTMFAKLSLLAAVASIAAGWWVGTTHGLTGFILAQSITEILLVGIWVPMLLYRQYRDLSLGFYLREFAWASSLLLLLLTWPEGLLLFIGLVAVWLIIAVPAHASAQRS